MSDDVNQPGFDTGYGSLCWSAFGTSKERGHQPYSIQLLSDKGPLWGKVTMYLMVQVAFPQDLLQRKCNSPYIWAALA